MRHQEKHGGGTLYANEERPKKKKWGKKRNVFGGWSRILIIMIIKICRVKRMKKKSGKWTATQ